MKTVISTIGYNQVTYFFAKYFIFCVMIFCIEKQLLCKGNFIVGEQPRRSSLSFAPSGLVSADSPGKSYLILIPLGSSFPENIRVLNGILKSILIIMCSLHWVQLQSSALQAFLCYMPWPYLMNTLFCSFLGQGPIFGWKSKWVAWVKFFLDLLKCLFHGLFNVIWHGHT